MELIPEGDRHGRPLDLFWTWTSPNLEFATVVIAAAVYLALNTGRIRQRVQQQPA